MASLLAVIIWLAGYLYPSGHITHTGPAELDQMVGSALSQWGLHSAVEDGGPGQQIVIDWGDTSESWADVDWSAWPDGTVLSCQVRIKREAQSLLGTDMERMLLSIVGHEVGHCLGFDHPADHGVSIDSIMAQAAFGWKPIDYEAAGLLYPEQTYTVTAPGITR